MISLDNRLLEKFYLNRGYYNAEINSSFAKLIDKNNLNWFTILTQMKIYFGNLDLKLPSDFEK